MSVINQDDDFLSAGGKIFALATVFAFASWAIDDIAYNVFLQFREKEAAHFAAWIVTTGLVMWPLSRLFGLAGFLYALAGGFLAMAFVMMDKGRTPVADAQSYLVAALAIVVGGIVVQHSFQTQRPP